MYYKYTYWPFLFDMTLWPLAPTGAEWPWLWLSCAISACALFFHAVRHQYGRALSRASDLSARLFYQRRPSARMWLAIRKDSMQDEVAASMGWQRWHGGAGGSPVAPVKLLTGMAHDHPGSVSLIKKIKLILRAMLHPQQTRRWLAYWNSTPMRIELAKAMPKLLPKIYRPYQSRRLRSEERIEILINHYDFIFRRGLDPLILRATRSPALLGSFTGKSELVYELRLSAAAPLEREGELILQLYCDQQPLFSIAFTFFLINGDWCVGIGCLQGPKGEDAQGRVRSATRDMFGMRPKALMLRLAREIGRSCGCTKAILVGNQNRVLVRQIRSGKLLADYDAFWREMGAARRPDGDYQISCESITLANLMDIPSHKRSEAKKRMALTNRAIDAVLPGFSRRVTA